LKEQDKDKGAARKSSGKSWTPIISIRGNLRPLSAYICENHVTRDPVPWGGKVRLPQRPEVSSKQATPLPLPNRLRQPGY